MRIAWVSVSPFAQTGYGRMTREICARLLRRHEVINIGHESDVIVWGGKKELRYGGTTLTCLVFTNPLISPQNALSMILMYHQKYEFDIIIAHWDAFALEFLNDISIPWLAYIPIDGPMTQAWANYVRNAYKIIAYSRFGYRELCKYFPPSRLSYIPHGVDTKVFRPLPIDKGKLREELSDFIDPPIPEDAFVFGYVATNIGDRKKIPLLIHTFARFIKRHGIKDAHLYLHTNPNAPLGRGYDLKEWCRMWKVEDKVHFPKYNPILEPADDELMTKIYNMLDIYVSNSCVPPDTLVVTWDGVKPICEIKEGDLVLTHKGRFKRVTKVFRRWYKGKLIGIRLAYLNRTIWFTPEHPILAIERPNLGTGSTHKPRVTIRRTRKGKELYEKWKMAMELREKYGWGHIRIAKVIGVSPSTVSNWIYKGQRPVPETVYEEPKWVPASKITKLHSVAISRIKDANVVINVKKYVSNYIEKDGRLYPIRRNQFGAIFYKPSDASLPAIINPEDNFLKLAGYYISEGFAHEDGIAICFSSLEKPFHDEARQILASIFGVKTRYVEMDRHRAVTWAYSKLLSQLMSNLFGRTTREREKRIPTFMLQLPRDKLEILLKSLLIGDGCYDKRGVWRYSTVCEKLALTLFLLLAKLGIPASIRYYGEKGYEVSFHEGWINGSISRKGAYITDEYIFVPVREVKEKEYEGWVYNLEVEDDHTYVVEGIAVHNCAEGFGLPILEAESCGIPCIVPNNSAQVELVKGHGWIVDNVPMDMYFDVPVYVPQLTYYPVPDQRSLMKAMYEAYRNPDLCRELGRKAREFALNYDWDKHIMPLWFKLLDDVEKELKMFRGIIE